MPDSNGEADGEAGGAPEVGAFGITGGEDGEDQLEGDEQLHEEAVSDRDLRVHLGKRPPVRPA